MCGDRAILLPFFAWGHIWGQPMDRVLSSLNSQLTLRSSVNILGLLGYLAFDPRLAPSRGDDLRDAEIYGMILEKQRDCRFLQSRCMKSSFVVVPSSEILIFLISAVEKLKVLVKSFLWCKFTFRFFSFTQLVIVVAFSQ